MIELPDNLEALQCERRATTPATMWAEGEEDGCHKSALLIVDDEANTLASLSRAFRLAGHEAAVCDNAEKALELAKSQPFDLILSDVVMPGKDGLTLLEDLKRKE